LQTKDTLASPFITWKSLIQSSSEKNQNLKEISLENTNSVKQKSDLGNLKNRVVWDEIFKKFLLPFSFESRIEENTEWMQEENSSKMVKIYKPMPLWNPNFNKKQLDLLKRQSTNKLHLKIFFPKSNHLADRQNFVPPLMPFFRRNEFPGTITSRRGKAVCWNAFQKKPHSPLFINHLNLLKNFFVKRKKIQINQDVPTRSWQPTVKLFQFLRDYLLSLQAYIRKNLKLPFLIIIKNFVRQLFFQPTEWEKDWNNLAKEVYVECDLYGKAVSIGVKLPNLFANDEPKQIKIINPFQLRFWTRSFSEKSSLQESENYSFLNVWGRETKMPFGKVKKSPSFWQLLIERIKLILQYKILKKISVSPSLDSVKIQKQIDLRSAETFGNEKKQAKFEIQKQFDIEQSKIDLTKTEKVLGSPDGPQVPLQGLGLKKVNNNDIKNNLKYKLTKRKILNKSTQITTVSQFQKKEKINRKRQYTVKNMLILLQRQWFHLYKLFLKKERELVFHLQKTFFEIKKFLQRKNTKILNSLVKLFYHISRFLRSLCYRISEFVNFLLIKFTKSQKQISSNIDLFDLNPTKNLSQAYIIHSIWEDKMISRPNITSLMKSWNENLPLKNNLEDFLNEQGILGNEKPENLTENQWQKWLINFRAYTPSLKIWALWAPNYWTQAVEQYWKELPSSKLKNILNQEGSTKIIDNTLNTRSFESRSLDTQTLNKFLEPHLPLFQAAQKQKKLWKFNIISRNYTEINNDGDVESFFVGTLMILIKKHIIYLIHLKK